MNVPKIHVIYNNMNSDNVISREMDDDVHVSCLVSWISEILLLLTYFHYFSAIHFVP